MKTKGKQAVTIRLTFCLLIASGPLMAADAALALNHSSLIPDTRSRLGRISERPISTFTNNEISGFSVDGGSADIRAQDRGKDVGKGHTAIFQSSQWDRTATVSAGEAADPTTPLISALQEVSAKLRATDYATSSELAQQNTEKYLAGLLAQAWGFAEQLNMLATPYFGRGAGIEGLPGLYNPDNLYRSALLEPEGAYRIYGRRGTHADLSFQIVDQYPIVGLGKNLMVIRPEDMGVEPGEDFEFYLGGQKTVGKSWFAMPEHAVAVLTRQSFGDWHETPSSLYIERLDVPRATSYQSPFVRAATALRQATSLWVDNYLPGLQRNSVVNALPAPRPSPGDAGGLGGQMSTMARYSVGKNEALLITVRKANAAYQGIQLGDPWFVTPNTVKHQVSLTARQAQVDDDGLIRFVISLEDPGVPNWLDPAGNPDGYIFMRWQNIKTPLAARDAPSARLVTLASLRKVLPAKTPFVDEVARRNLLSERKWAPQAR